MQRLGGFLSVMSMNPRGLPTPDDRSSAASARRFDVVKLLAIENDGSSEGLGISPRDSKCTVGRDIVGERDGIRGYGSIAACVRVGFRAVPVSIELIQAGKFTEKRWCIVVLHCSGGKSKRSLQSFV